MSPLTLQWPESFTNVLSDFLNEVLALLDQKFLCSHCPSSHLTLVLPWSFICISQTQHLVLDFPVLSVSVHFLISWTTHVFGQRVRINPWKTLYLRVIHFHRSKESLAIKGERLENPEKWKTGICFPSVICHSHYCSWEHCRKKNLVWRCTSRSSDVGITYRT